MRPADGFYPCGVFLGAEPRTLLLCGLSRASAVSARKQKAAALRGFQGGRCGAKVQIYFEPSIASPLVGFKRATPFCGGSAGGSTTPCHRGLGPVSPNTSPGQSPELHSSRGFSPRTLGEGVSQPPLHSVRQRLCLCGTSTFACGEVHEVTSDLGLFGEVNSPHGGGKCESPIKMSLQAPYT